MAKSFPSAQLDMLVLYCVITQDWMKALNCDFIQKEKLR
jgi:hypothetical protein